MKKLLFSSLLSIPYLSVYAHDSPVNSTENIKVFTSDSFPPIVIRDGNNLTGIMGDVLVESTKGIAKYDANFFPWPLAQEKALSSKNSLIIPLARTKEREKKFKWISKVYDDPVCVFTLKPNSPINNEEDAKKLNKIGIINGVATFEIAKKLGIENKLVPEQDGNKNAKKLKSGEIDAWITAVAVAKYLWKENNFDPNLLQCSTPVKLNHQVYIGTSLQSDNTFVNKISESIENFKKTEKFKLILDKYGVTYSTPSEVLE